MSGKRSVILCCGFLLLALAISTSEAADKICGKHARYLECGPSCETRCDTLGDPCLIRFIRCPDGCFCKKGFARDANEECIPIAKCPPRRY